MVDIDQMGGFHFIFTALSIYAHDINRVNSKSMIYYHETFKVESRTRKLLT